MEVLLEQVIVYSVVGIIIGTILYLYMRKRSRESRSVEEKIERAKKLGFYEPVSLHPVIDLNLCIGSGACISACPEQDILGWRHGRGETIHAARCVGHGACFHACPVEAISLVMGTEKRGVELPHVNQKYESNVPGIYIAGELGGMGLIKNAVEQGKQAIENITKSLNKKDTFEYDVIIVGAGPAGIAGALTAKKNNLKFRILEQETLGGTVASFPRSKIVMTSPMDLPLFGKIKLYETSKDELLQLWDKVLTQNEVNIDENVKVASIDPLNNGFSVQTNREDFSTKTVLLAVGRRGTPRKLGVPGEKSDKVYYRLLEPELIKNSKVLVVGGGDSAVESAMLIADEGNEVIISYRGENFSRIKPDNYERINEAISENKIEVLFESNVLEIMRDQVKLRMKSSEEKIIDNDLVYVFIGGELPNQFLKNAGIEITKKYGEVILKH